MCVKAGEFGIAITAALDVSVFHLPSRIEKSWTWLREFTGDCLGQSIQKNDTLRGEHGHTIR